MEPVENRKPCGLYRGAPHAAQCLFVSGFNALHDLHLISMMVRWFPGNDGIGLGLILEPATTPNIPIRKNIAASASERV